MIFTTLVISHTLGISKINPKWYRFLIELIYMYIDCCPERKNKGQICENHEDGESKHNFIFKST